MAINMAVILRKIDPDFLGRMDLDDICSFLKLFGNLGSNEEALLQAKEIWINNHPSIKTNREENDGAIQR